MIDAREPFGLGRYEGRRNGSRDSRGSVGSAVGRGRRSRFAVGQRCPGDKDGKGPAGDERHAQRSKYSASHPMKRGALRPCALGRETRNRVERITWLTSASVFGRSNAEATGSTPTIRRAHAACLASTVRSEKNADRSAGLLTLGACPPRSATVRSSIATAVRVNAAGSSVTPR